MSMYYYTYVSLEIIGGMEMTKKLIGLIAFVVTGVGMMTSTVIKNMNFLNIGCFAIVGCLFAISLVEHFNELKN